MRSKNIINSHPLTTTSDDPNDLDALTSNDLLLLKRSQPLPPGVFEPADCYSRKQWRQVQYLADVFWSRWIKEYLPILQKRNKWSNLSLNLSLGDVVSISEPTLPAVVVVYTIPSEGWGYGRRPWSPRSQATPQGLDQRS